MKVVLQSHIGIPPMAIDEVNHLAVYESDEPLALMWRDADGTIKLTRAGEADFDKLTSQMGLGKRTDVRCIRL